MKDLSLQEQQRKINFWSKAIHDDKGWHTDKEPAWGHWGVHYGINL